MGANTLASVRNMANVATFMILFLLKEILMKTRSKILVLLLALALICGILVVSTSAAETNPDGVTDHIKLQTGTEVGTGEQRGGTLTAHTSDTGNAYYRHFYAKELAKNQNQYSFSGAVANYFENPDKFL